MAFSFLRISPFSSRFCLPSSTREPVSRIYLQDHSDLRQAIRLSLIAFVALFLGVAVYLFVRGSQNVYLLPEWSGFRGWGPPGLRHLTGNLPSFVHVYSFILLTAATLAPWRALSPVICLFWLLSESLFEIGQHPDLAPFLAGLVPDHHTSLAFLEAVRSFFLNGTFDPMDIAALAAGTLFAYLTISWSRKGRCFDAD